MVMYLIYKKIERDNPPPPPDIIKEIKYRISYVDPRFEHFDIRESTSSSYTEDKTVIYICTKDPKTKQYYDMNTLVYVCLHECAHMISKKYDGHGDEFKKILSKLVQIAKMRGIYDPRIPVPDTYCGLN